MHMEHRYANDLVLLVCLRFPRSFLRTNLAVSFVMWKISRSTKSRLRADKQGWFRVSVRLLQGPKLVATVNSAPVDWPFLELILPCTFAKCCFFCFFFVFHLADAFFSNRFWATFEKITSGALRHFFFLTQTLSKSLWFFSPCYEKNPATNLIPDIKHSNLIPLLRYSFAI